MPYAVSVLLFLAVFVVPVSPVTDWYVLRHLQFAVLAAGAVMLAAQHSPALLNSVLARKLGQVSYSMYLVHFAFIKVTLELAKRLAGEGNWTSTCLHFLFCTGASFAVSAVVYRILEQPVIDWAAVRSRAARPAAALLPGLSPAAPVAQP